ncbi:MAG: hypothetical protein ACPLRW_11510 [Moorellales bacterium]
MGYLDIAKNCRRQEPCRRVRDHRGRVVCLFRARRACLEAGRCLQLSRELDCDLAPVSWRWGWCRQRVPACGREQDEDHERAKGGRDG